MQLLGVSTDPVDSHKKFCDSLKLPFPLLSDSEGKVSKAYGIIVPAKQGPGPGISGRSVFLVDRGGIVRYADSKYDLGPADHKALLEAVKALGEKERPGEEKPGEKNQGAEKPAGSSAAKT